jgi:hypothetical protein
MVAALRAGQQFPAVVVMATDRSRGFGLVHGLNRTHARRVLRRSTIRARGAVLR